MSEWKKSTLGEMASVQTGPFGSQLKNEQYVTGGTPVVTVEHIKDFLIEDFVYPSVTDEDRVRLKKYTLKAGDIVFSRVGSVDLSAPVKKHQDGWLFSSRMLRVRVNRELDSDFLSYYLRQLSIRQFIINIAVGSTMPSINTNILKSLPIIYCSLEEQKEIASTLSCLDRKIENLRKQNETLEAIAQTLFQHWFIDFEFPNADGKPYKSSGGAMEPSELGQIPEGWRVGYFSDFFNLLSGGTPKTSIPEYWNGNIKWLSAKDVTNNHSGFILETEKRITNLGVNKSAAQVLPKYTTIVSARGTVGNYCILSEAMAISQSNFGVIPHENDKIFYGILLISSLIEDLKRSAYGSVFDTVTARSFKELRILLPNKLEIEKFEKIASLIYRKILLQSRQIRTLIQIRDVLLPKLMSGQIRISN